MYKALRDIEPGEELCISYGRLWFPDADLNVLQQPEEEDTILERLDIEL